jgi:dTDP-4-amino-4,6-dideoxygalactose transaminase
MSNFHVPLVDLAAQHNSLQPALGESIDALLASSEFIGGEVVDRFEIEFAKWLGIEHCISCANGTDALIIALKGLGTGPGDEIVTTAHSWVSTAEAIVAVGAVPVFCDTESDTFNINPQQIRERLTTKTVGIIPVHLYGLPADMKSILNIANERGLWVVEDCAQAHGATFEGQPVGTFGDAACFSFFPSKNLGAIGDAGCLVTANSTLADWSRLYARHGQKGKHLISGINSRMDALQAVVLNLKLPHLNDWIAQRQQVARFYLKELQGVGDLHLPMEVPDTTHAYHLFTIKTQRRDQLRDFLTNYRIGTTVNYPVSLPFLPAFSQVKNLSDYFPNSRENQDLILSIPMYPEISRKQLTCVIESIQDFYK